MNRIAFSTDHWQCPHCRAALVKGMWLTVAMSGNIPIGSGTCAQCEKSVSQSMIYSGEYDLIPWDSRGSQLVFMSFAEKEQWKKDFLREGVVAPYKIPTHIMRTLFLQLIHDAQRRFPARDVQEIIGLCACRLTVAVAISEQSSFYEAYDLLRENAQVEIGADGIVR